MNRRDVSDCILPAVILVLIAAVLASLVGCAGVQRPAEGRGLTVKEQHAAAVRITTCNNAYGSGVIIGEHRVLTAAHVLEGCPIVVVTLADGRAFFARTEHVWNDDVATARVAATLRGPPVPVASVSVGDRVCLVAGAPRRVRSCGAVLGVAAKVGGIDHSAVTVPGNSGAGVYDLRGRLVGVLVWYQTGHGGYATPIGDRLEAAP